MGDRNEQQRTAKSVLPNSKDRARDRKRKQLAEAIALGHSLTSAAQVAGYASLAHVSRLAKHDAAFRAEVEELRLGMVERSDVVVVDAQLDPVPARQLTTREVGAVIATKIDLGSEKALAYLTALVVDETEETKHRVAAARALLASRPTGPAVALQINNTTNETSVNVRALLVDDSAAKLAADLLAKLGGSTGLCDNVSDPLVRGHDSRGSPAHRSQAGTTMGTTGRE